MTVIESLAEAAVRLDPPPLAVRAARRCFLDWMGGTIAGGIEAPASLMIDAFPGTGAARLIPSGARRDARTAALINGAASHTVEVDDIYRSGLYHPGVVVIPAALAVAEAEGLSGARLLNAIIAGYEVSNRIARTVNPAHYAYWHTTATVGHFGAAVAAGMAMGLSVHQLSHAMGSAATFAAGLRHAFSSDAMSKPLHAGRAAEAGISAALMARAEVTGVLDMLEGTRGFGKAMSDAPDWATVCDGMGEEWTIAATTVKAHACCGHNFAALDAVRTLMDEHAVAPDDIAQIRVGSYRATVEICGNASPTTAAEGRFSLPWCAATIARTGSVTPASFTDSALSDPETRALAARVVLSEDADAEARFPDARSATVTIKSMDGSEVTHHRPTRKGDPDDPLTDVELAAKYRGLADPVIGPAAAQMLQQAIDNIDQLEDIRGLPVGFPADAAQAGE